MFIIRFFKAQSENSSSFVSTFNTAKMDEYDHERQKRSQHHEANCSTNSRRRIYLDEAFFLIGHL
jgi:hypothetical protein